MMSSPVLKPESPCLTISQFFQNSYIVPQFQRGYAWKDAQVNDFLQDIYEFLDSQGNNPIYLLGQVIVSYSRGPEEFELIDGQQRTTTLLLLLIALYKRFSQIPNWHLDRTLRHHYQNLESLILYTNQTTAGIGGLRPRVSVAGDGADLINAIINGTESPTIIGWTRENIKNAYDRISEFLDTNWQDVNLIPDLYYRIVNRIYLVRLELPSPELAVRVFERINNRGLSLSSADLVKNLIFTRVNNQDLFDDISEDWDKASRTLYTCSSGRLRSMEYLLRAMVIIRTGEMISNTNMREVWRDSLHNDVEAKQFAQSIPPQAQILQNLDKGLLPSGGNTIVSQGSKYFGIVQHFPILLASAHFATDIYEFVAKIVEDRVIISLLAKERPQDFERLVPRWSKRLSLLPQRPSKEQILEASSEAFLDSDRLLRIVRENIYSLRYKRNSDRSRIRYILARISRKVMIDAHQNGAIPDLNALLTTSRTTRGRQTFGYDIEHIRPASVYGDASLTDSIGNLVLAHPNDQRGAGDNESYDERKKAVYRSSNMILTKSLCDYSEIAPSLSVGERQVVTKIHEISPPYLHDWNDEAIQRRTSLYLQYFLEDLAIRIDVK